MHQKEELKIEFFTVGGKVRDDLMGIPSKDVDFAVIAPSFDALTSHLEENGFTIFQSKPEFATIRAHVPVNHPLRAITKVADFVLCRKDGPSSNGRHPDFIEPGNLFDDLARRDFTVNAIARDINGNLIDPWGGLVHIEHKILDFVGNPWDRVQEDGLRVMRGFRFMVTKGLEPLTMTDRVLRSELAANMLAGVSIERVKDELDKMLAHDTIKALDLLSDIPIFTLKAIFRDGLHLVSSLKKV